MATSREDDNSGPMQRPGGLPEPVTGLPPDWGRIVIPDDASELAHEASRVHRELRRAARRRRWMGSGDSVFRAPITIIVFTLLLALSSLFSMIGPLGRAPQGTSTEAAFTNIALTGEQGQAVWVRDHLPAIMLLLGSCTCTNLVDGVAGATPTGVSILLVGGQNPPNSGPGIRLADPARKMSNALGVGAPAPDKATVVLIDNKGQVTRLLPDTNSVEDFRAQLAALHT